MVFDPLFDPFLDHLPKYAYFPRSKNTGIIQGVSKRVSKWVKRVEKPIFSRARGDSLTFPQWFVLGSSVCVLTIAYNRKMFWDRFWPFFDQKMVQKWGVYTPNGSVPGGSKKRSKWGSLLGRLKEGFSHIWGQKGVQKWGQKWPKMCHILTSWGSKKWVTKCDRLDRLDFLEFGGPQNVTFGTLVDTPWIRPVFVERGK